MTSPKDLREPLPYYEQSYPARPKRRATEWPALPTLCDTGGGKDTGSDPLIGFLRVSDDGLRCVIDLAQELDTGLQVKVQLYEPGSRIQPHSNSVSSCVH